MLFMNTHAYVLYFTIAEKLWNLTHSMKKSPLALNRLLPMEKVQTFCIVCWVLGYNYMLQCSMTQQE